MSGDRPKLSHEDRIIWARVARTVDPLPGKSVEDEQWFVAEPENPDPAPANPPPASGPPKIRTIVEPAAIETKAGLKPFQKHPIERPVVRKLARGRLPIDGKIDLHGLTQSEAHNLLFDFLARAHERGLRHVLVITGKGSSHGSQGVLKRVLPEWLAKPEFRFLISGHQNAARSHGGEGALYIRLRRERGGPR
ncbi:MAG: Smr/MutS family protein [Hoeflea sp.]|uniref:Smr/MutS family protein n=1 Tax=Hoeflea sp. TaxID=1940281 RepID=UPI0032EEED90